MNLKKSVCSYFKGSSLFDSKPSHFWMFGVFTSGFFLGQFWVIQWVLGTQSPSLSGLCCLPLGPSMNGCLQISGEAGGLRGAFFC